MKRAALHRKIIVMGEGSQSLQLELLSPAPFLNADRTLHKPFDRHGLLGPICNLLIQVDSFQELATA